MLKPVRLFFRFGYYMVYRVLNICYASASANSLTTIQNLAEHEPVAVFEIGFQHNNWKEKDNTLSENQIVTQFMFLTKNHKFLETLFYAQSIQFFRYLGIVRVITPQARTKAKAKHSTQPTATSDFRGQYLLIPFARKGSEITSIYIYKIMIVLHISD